VKIILVLILLAFVAGLIYWRLRPYVRAARRFLALVREANRMNAPQAPADLPRRPGRRGDKLVRCASCGTWTPPAQAVTLRATGVSYCSHACLERAADAPRRAHKSAS
jgi:hypothetical protein